MIEGKHISRFFLALAAGGFQLTRKELGTRVFWRNWTAKKLDELLEIPLLARYITVSNENVRKGDRHPTRYLLTEAGRDAARAWRLPMPANWIAPEEVQRQFANLVAIGNPWAKTLERDAGLWRVHDEAEKRLRAEKADAGLLKKQEQERIHPEVKHPSAKRHRTAKDLADRADWFSAKLREKAGEPAVTPHPAAPASSLARISAAPSSVPGVHGGRGGFRQPSAPLPAVSSVAQRPQVRPRMVADTGRESLDAEDLRILRVASEHMYQRNEESKILYDNQWITPKAWWERMKSSFE